ncbi:cobalamin B12-binding domain-containing protein [Catenulispora subtropica]|uniref:Cobalamin-dependent protein n=1 Tax=Catenulispora subtropica TaxID=450798 RepID=A0ABN2T579_9ACTN
MTAEPAESAEPAEPVGGTDVTDVTDDARTAFDQCLAQADEAAATTLVLDLLDRGVSAEDLLLDLIAPAQAAVGARWAANEWNVAQEHAATYVSDRAVSALAVATRAVRDGRGSVVLACPDGEWHSLPARVVSEVLRLRGFRVHFLGSSVPTAHLVSYLHQHDSDLMAMSCMLAARLPRAYRAVEACRLVGVPVLAGGSGFGPEGVWARSLGASMYAPTARAAADILLRRWPPPLTGHPTLDHLADGEYAELSGRRGAALDAMVRQVTSRISPLGELTEESHDLVVENLGFLMDNLSAAVFVDDARVFTAFLDFTVDMMTARGIPPASLLLAVQALTQPLHDLPRTMGHVTVGRERLERPDTVPEIADEDRGSGAVP